MTDGPIVDRAGSARGVVKPRRLESLGRRVARDHERRASTAFPLAAPVERPQEAGRALRRAYRELAESALGRGDLPPGAAWILDNFYLVRDQLRDLRYGLSRSHYRRLPRLDDGPYAGSPRIYELMAELVHALDHSLAEVELTTLVRAYQEVSPLALGELWAAPGALRVVLLERLAALATEEVDAYRERLEAAEWARRIAAAANLDPAEGVIAAGELFGERERLPEAFVLELAERLRARGSSVRPILDWIERRLERRQLTIEDIVRQETQRHVSLSNAFTSLRWASTARWGPWVERVSLMERVLRLDPLHVYPDMDFETRDRYRGRVEALARGSAWTELEVAERTVETARTAPARGEATARHVGYHLIGPGREPFEEALGFAPPMGERLRRAALRHPDLCFFGAMGLVMAGLMTALVGMIANRGAGPGTLVILGAAATLPLLDFAVALTNRALADLLPPELLPKLSRKRGIPEEDRALVVVPTIIRSPRDAREQAEHLEVLAFADPDPNLRFALLSDFADAPEAETPGDADTLAAAVAAVGRLNALHADEWGDRFFLLHRERRWSPTERCWLGWERKRGKLEELNRLLRDPGAETSYTTIEGEFFEVTTGGAIRYVITLDADTRMPPMMAVDLVRTASHPLNRPRYDARRRRVTEGYGIIQPRVAIEASRAPRTPFARIMSGNVGIDPYAHAVSDAYQDLFGEGIYTGKGMYDVDTFREALEGVIPPAAVLSHDLLESTFARAGLATDIVLFDRFPTHYIPWARRLHRWIRGDWQILPWLRRKIRVAEGRRIRSPIRAIGRWQIFDNARRSLTPAGNVAFLVSGWLALPDAAGWWTVVALAFPTYVNLTTAVFERPPRATWMSWLKRLGAELAENAVQTALLLTLLAHRAAYQLDAAARASFRLVTRRKLLQWVTAQEVERATRTTPGAYLRFMSPAPAIGLGTAAAVATIAPAALPFVVPFSLLWVASPFIAWRLSLPGVREVRELTAEERTHLRAVGRRTWAYFEDVWSAEHSWLPPDNFQVDPFRGVAARTSPTNIGFALVAAQAAYELGWLTRDGYLERIERTLEAVDALEKYQGHLYNWYDTVSGARLWPAYVSTADSGNLAASFVVLAAGLDRIAGEPAADPGFLAGLADTTRVARDLGETEGAREMADALLAAIEPAGRDPDRAAGLRRLEGLAAELELESRPGARNGAPEATARLEGARRRLTSAPLHAIRVRLEELDTDPLEAARRAARLAAACRRLFDAMDFRFLYAPRRGLLTIGYNVDTRRQDAGAYDLLASEARLASLIATARGDVPIEHWFRLARPVVDAGRRPTLLSWGGTMFEYLMPLVFTPDFRPTLLADSYAGAVAWQRKYGERQGLPWGVSESQYASVNSELDYRYRAFGVPGLGLRRGLADDYVVAPYASALALMVDARAAYENLVALERMGAAGEYGFYEAVDFTPARLPAGEDRFIVRTFMGHHAGMSLAAICNTLLENRIQNLFRSSHRMRAVELLLQERVPVRILSTVPHPLETDIAPAEAPPVREVVDHVPLERWGATAARGQFLSNGRLRSFFHRDGTGSIALEERALIRSDPTDRGTPLGLFLYVRDLESGRFWSAGYEPVRSAPDRLELWFHLNKVELARVEDWIETFVEIVVSPEDDIEIRRLTITNYSDRPRRLDVTSYAEVVLDEPRADRAHPAFSKLFVRTERSRSHEALLATRRPRNAGAGAPWLVHTLAFDRARMPDPARFETDRLRFVGRGRGLDRPRAMEPGFELSGSEGNVLDPILSLQKPFMLGPGESVQIAFCLGAAPDRDAAIRLADVYDSPAAVRRAIGLATTSATLERQHLAIDGERIQAYQQLGSAIHTANPVLRAPRATLASSRGSQADLWRQGISGDLPIVVSRLRSMSELDHATWLQEAFAYWRRKGLDVDLVYLNEHGPSYVDELHHALERLAEKTATGGRGIRGRVHVLRADRLPEEERLVLLAAARAVFDRELPELPLRARPGMPGDPRPADAEPERRRLLRRRGAPAADDVAAAPPERRASGARRAPEPGRAQTLFSFNGFGGFDRDAREYVVRPADAAPERPPAPWVNVIANPGFGFLVSESGSTVTWSVNSRQRRLSPWSNDPVRDPTGEALYVRDDDDGRFWSPLVEPVGDARAVEARHGLGYSRFHGASAGLEHDVTMHVDVEHPVKGIRLRLRNRRDRTRSLSVFFYLEWVLGVLRSESAPHVVTALDRGARLTLAWNRYDPEFAGRVAFVAADPGGPEFDGTCDRTSFLGASCDLRRPEALLRLAPLDGRDGAGLDPCAAQRVEIDIEPGGEATLWFLVGDGADEDEARRLAARFREPGAAERSLEDARGFWRDLTRRVTVRTPAPELDALLDGWLLYQTLSCRVWGRTAFYQSGGAFGFRDQLQDAMALVYARPDLTRDQILLHAAHQFPEGDVLHWWHPPDGRGVRTRISDDLLWLPYVVSFYVGATGDRALLDEEVRYLEARTLEEEEHEAYLHPRPGSRTGDVYDHCGRAIDRALRFGTHGLPLMGTSDWNDGMNRVGAGGRGESVWLGFFLVAVLDGFLPFALERGDEARASRYRTARDALADALERAGWDGEWYRRAYFDDGTPLGSALNDECRIDAIAQAWAVTTGVAAPERAAAALASLERLLVDEEGRLVRLLTPPFERSEPDPGYIRGYPPGVRENGGQYTHGALWAVEAFARQGRGDRAVALLRMMAPPNHARSLAEASTFRNEPYVVSADVYSASPHVGRGGWSWYTGSGAWMYRIALESILGLRLVDGAAVRLSPCIASEWREYRVELTAPDGRTRYAFHVENPDGVQTGIAEVEVDGRVRRVGRDAVRIDLASDGGRHEVRVRLGDPEASGAVEGAHASGRERDE